MFRFKIRDVLWLTVVVAVAVGWWIHSRQQGQAVRFANSRTADLEKYCAESGLEVTWTPDGSKVFRPRGDSAAYYP